MKASFRIATAVAEELEDGEVFVVAFAEDASGESGSLVLEVALGGFDDEDRVLGLASYSITVDSGPTTYGGIEGCELSGNFLTLRLSEGASRTLGTPTELELELLGGEAKRREIEAGLRRLFELAESPLKIVVR